MPQSKEFPLYEDEYRHYKLNVIQRAPADHSPSGSHKTWNRTWTEDDLTVRQKRNGWTVKDHILHDADGNPRCSAAQIWSVHAGKPVPCHRKPTPGMKRCHIHGGASPTGAAVHTHQWRVSRNRKRLRELQTTQRALTNEIAGYIAGWKVEVMEDGSIVPSPDLTPEKVVAKQVRYKVPKSLQEAFDAQMEIEDYLNGKDEISLIASRIQQLLNTVTDGGSPETWRSLNETARAASRCRREGDKEGFDQAVSTMFILIAEGDKEHKTYSEIIETMESMRRMRETEIKRLTAAQNSIKRDDVLQFFKAYQQLVIEASANIKDIEERKKFLADVQRRADSMMGGK